MWICTVNTWNDTIPHSLILFWKENNSRTLIIELNEQLFSVEEWEMWTRLNEVTAPYGGEDDEFQTLSTVQWVRVQGLSCLLSISFFQKGTPELVLSERFSENQLVVEGRDAVVHNHINPFAITPELRRGRQNRKVEINDNKGRFWSKQGETNSLSVSLYDLTVHTSSLLF